ncbi:hypothetical protein WN51_12625 [Melipona quadrifasciata]|uniref:Uncharacterized protein n=1 Tax=Melipona quadrifasciata TaxID=166423 RepID=A0A0N0BGR7_9HYME|nr:hypothetical protein WN51_12625 [Melipona quadrifasciata]
MSGKMEREDNVESERRETTISDESSTLANADTNVAARIKFGHGCRTDDNLKSLTVRLAEQSAKLQETQITPTFDEMLLTLEILYSEFADKINEFYNTIILGKNGIIDTTLINIDHFIQAYKDVTKTKPITISTQKENFQTIIDISKLTAVIIDDTIIYQIEIPILEEHEWTVIKYYPIPCQIHNVFLAPLIDDDMILKQAGSQIIINEYYLKQYRKNSPLGLICERTQPTRHDYRNEVRP